MVIQTMTYGVEIRANPNKTKHILRTVEKNILEAINGRTKQDRDRNVF